MKRKPCPHHTQYAEPGRPLPCADPRCSGSPAGNGYIVPRLVAGGIERALFTRVWDDGVIVWRQETPWQWDIDFSRIDQAIIAPEGGRL